MVTIATVSSATSTAPAASSPIALFVADNVALDFLNTEYGVGAAHCDCLSSDASVVAWLQAARVIGADVGSAPKGLHALAVELRAGAKLLISAAKVGAPADASVINRVLESGRPVKELAWDSEHKGFKVAERRGETTAASLLEPIAAALVDLLTNAELELVKQCEADDCTLLFHDLTKSHRRRWCSMAACGNRVKVAAFRARKKAE